MPSVEMPRLFTRQLHDAVDVVLDVQRQHGARSKTVSQLRFTLKALVIDDVRRHNRFAVPDPQSIAPPVGTISTRLRNAPE